MLVEDVGSIPIITTINNLKHNIMIYTNTVSVGPSKCDENIKSISQGGLSYYLPIDLNKCLNEEIRSIYNKHGEKNILNINITPITAIFRTYDNILMQYAVRFIVIYTYKDDTL